MAAGYTGYCPEPPMMGLRSLPLRQIWALGLEGAKFGGVGLLSTAVHVMIFSAAIEFWSIEQMKANLIAFGFAFWVSLFGHFYWTFASGDEGRRNLKGAGVRFLVVALVGLALNSLVVYVVESMYGLPYVYATIGMIFVVPVVLFLLSRFWAFTAVARR
jgi:putative flippase GtrA